MYHAAWLKEEEEEEEIKEPDEYVEERGTLHF